MTLVTSASLCLILFSVFTSKVQNTITAESGQNVTLPCRAPNNNILAVNWSRADLGEEYVFFLQGKWVVSDNQHPSFKNRVDLQDRQMKDGDVSLILKDVTTADDGRYECRVFLGSWQSINTTKLGVVSPGHLKDGSVGLIVGLSVSAVLLIAALFVAFIIYKKNEKKSGFILVSV